jgi:hypothetical protein
MIEIILVLISLEISVNLIWMRLQILIEFLVKFMLKESKLNLYQEMGGDRLLEFIILSMAAYFLYYSAMITNNSGNFKSYADELIGKFQNKQVTKCAVEPICKPEIEAPKQTTKSNIPRSIKPAAH